MIHDIFRRLKSSFKNAIKKKSRDDIERAAIKIWQGYFVCPEDQKLPEEIWMESSLSEKQKISEKYASAARSLGFNANVKKHNGKWLASISIKEPKANPHETVEGKRIMALGAQLVRNYFDVYDFGKNHPMQLIRKRPIPYDAHAAISLWASHVAENRIIPITEEGLFITQTEMDPYFIDMMEQIEEDIRRIDAQNKKPEENKFHVI